jgi:2-phosphoglycerate kinase
LLHVPLIDNEKKVPIERQKSAVPYDNLLTQTPRTLLRTDIKESRSIWPSTKRLIEDPVDSHEDFIVEGVHLLPVFVKQLQATPIWERLKVIYLVKTDLDDILSGFHKNESKHDWLAGALSDQALLKKVAKMVQTESLYIKKQAQEFGFSCVDTSVGFTKTLRSILKQL